MILKKLFSPLKIGTMEVKNRIVYPAMVTDYATFEDGSVTERLKDYYMARAEGGAGLIIVEATTPDQFGKLLPFQTGIWDDKHIPGWRDLVSAVHAHGAKIAIQICHAGRQGMSALNAGRTPVAPSPLPCPYLREIPHELTIEEIEELVDKFAAAARRAAEAGFDAVEIHGTHGYLLAQFMSPFTNRRTDAYGGSLEGRLKMPVEIISRVRKELGPDYPLLFRIASYEGPPHGTPDGRTVAETPLVARLLVEAGLDCIDISAGSYAAAYLIIPPSYFPVAFNVVGTEAVKRAVGVPVIIAGRINDPLIAEQILEEDKADLIAMGRALIADPELPKKAAAGDLEDIRRCLGCTIGCAAPGGIMGGTFMMHCVVNPFVGEEKTKVITAAEKPKKVLVAGGGPGGLEAALVAALRGHDVTLMEKAEKLGGQFNVAAVPPFKQESTTIIKWLSAQAKKAGVKIELGREVTPQLVNELKPDVVIVATGAVPLIPDIPGVNKERVTTAHDVLAGKIAVGDKVVIIGGGMVGFETADFLGQRRHIAPSLELTIVSRRPDPSEGMPGALLPLMIERLRQYGVRIIPCAETKEILDDGVVLNIDGREETIRGIDNIILARGVKSVNGLAEQLKGKVAEVYVIGDAKEPRLALDAIAEGAQIGLQI